MGSQVLLVLRLQRVRELEQKRQEVVEGDQTLDVLALRDDEGREEVEGRGGAELQRELTGEEDVAGLEPSEIGTGSGGGWWHFPPSPPPDSASLSRVRSPQPIWT